MDVVKENIPAMADDTRPPVAIMSAKKLAPTPRQPLMDLKQVARPVVVDGVSKMANKSKPQTPLCTPKVKKATRKIQPSALVYVEGDYKQESANPQLPNIDIDIIPEEGVSEFVTQVLEKCMQDIRTESAGNLEGRNTLEKDVSPEETNIDNTEDAEDMFLSFNKDTEYVTVETHDKTTDLSISEFSLLGDTSQYTDCSESFTVSAKTEDELLASFCDISNIDDKSVHSTSQCSEKQTCHTGFSYVEKREPTPRATFLEKVALTHRVREAASSLSSWVIPQEQMTLHLQREPAVGKAKLVHDIACSPIIVNDVLKQLSINSNDKDEATGNNIVEEGNLERDVQSVTENIISKIVEEEKSKECAIISSPAAKSVENKVVNSVSSARADAVEDTVKATACTPVKATVNCSTNLEIPDAIETKPAQCSMPKYVEVGVQSVIENQSVMCSPISIPVHDTSTKTQSVMCSPIPIEVFDISVQHEIETQSVMCSPMVVPVCDISIQQEPEMQSIMCSPMRIPVLDTSVQNVAETQSAVCSPMVPCPSHDKSVLVSGPDLIDMGVGTEQVVLQDTGITVAPEMENVATEMNDLPMISAGTSMTPIKLGNKQGRKLTADDIRKQHPRVLANQLDTLMVENGRLEGLVRNLERQTKRLVAQEELVKELDEVRLSHSELKQKYDKEMSDWHHRCDKLEAEVAVAKLEHHNEIIKLKEDYEATDYRDHFLASQKLVLELQADLEQYSKLVEDIDCSQKLQVELEDVMSVSWTNLKTACEKIACFKQKLDEQIGEVARQKAENKEEFVILEDQKAILQSQRHEMKEMVTVYKQNMIELETKMKQTSVELKTAQDKVTSLETELDKANKDNEDQKATMSALSNDLEQLKQTEEKLNGEVTELQAALTQRTEELQSVSTSLTATIASRENDAAEYKKAEKKCNLAIVNLERTLEMREHDIDSMEKELFECREIIYTQLENINVMEVNNKSTTAELESVKAENVSLRDCCAVLRGKEQELRATLESVQEELLGTKDHATRIIKKQGSEITDCFTALAELTDGMKSVLTNLNQRAGIQKVGLNSSLSSAIDEVTELGSSQVTLSSHATTGSQNSLVSQILHAAKSVETALDSAVNTTGKPQTGAVNTTEDTQTGAVNTTGDTQTGATDVSSTSDKQEHNQSASLSQTLSKQKLGHDESSAFVLVKSVTESETVNQSNSVDKSTAPEQPSKSISVEKTDGIGKWAAEEKGENCLVPQVDKMSSLFTEIMRVAHLLEKALKSSLNDVREENDDLNCRMFQCEYAERRLHAELELRQSELTKSQAMSKQLQGHLDEMGERLGRAWDNQAEVKQQQLEIRNLRGKIQSLEGEKELLNEQISELLQQIDAQSAGGAGDPEEAGTLRKEMLKQQKKLERYRALQMESDSRMEELSSKAARRIQKLEDNWQKADAEVCRLDELVDIIRKELVGSEALRRDVRLQRLVNMIDGVEHLSSSKKKSGDLKPVKTAKW